MTATNLGPGKVKVQALALVKWSAWKKLTHGIEYAALLHDFKHPLGGTLPQDLDVGQEIQLSLNPEECKFLGENYTYIGICDSFGRTHWCKKQDMVDAAKSFHEKRWMKKDR